MPISGLFAVAALPAAIVLGGCAGSSNNRSAATVTTTPSAFPAEIADIGNTAPQASARPRSGAAASPRISADNPMPSVQAYRISGGGSASSPVTVTLLSQSDTDSDGGPEALALDPSRRFLFVADEGDGDGRLRVYQINADGNLSASPAAVSSPDLVTAGTNMEVAVAAPTPSGTEYVYAASGQANGLQAFSFNTSSHTLTPFTPGVSSIDRPNSLATDNTGTHLYTGGGFEDSTPPFEYHPTVTSYVINPTDGTLTAETTQAAGVSDSAFALVVNDPAASAVFGYNSFEQTNTLFSYSTAGGTLTSTGQLQAGTSGNDLAIAPNGSAVYLSNGTNGTITGSAIGSGGNLGGTHHDRRPQRYQLGRRRRGRFQPLRPDPGPEQRLRAGLPHHVAGQPGAPVAAALSGNTPVSAVFVPAPG